MGKLRLAFLVFSIAILQLSHGEVISHPYSAAIWGKQATKHSNKNVNSKGRVLVQEETVNQNTQQTIKHGSEDENEATKQQEMIVSPEFIGAISHNHDENQDGYIQNQGFDKLITQTYNDLNGYQVHADAYGAAQSSGETSKELEQLINLVSPKPDNQRIPDITQLRNISIDQLPLALP